MDFFKLDQVLKPQGIKGELKLRPFVDDLARFSELTHVYLKQGSEYICRKVEYSRIYRSFAYIKISGCEDRNQAEMFRGFYLYIDREHATPPAEGGFYIADLIGMDVFDNTGTKLGNVADVFNTGAADIYVIKGARGFLFPDAPGVILKTNLAARKIILDAVRLKEVAVYD